MSQLDPRIETIFASAMDIADANERAAFAERACAGDETLRREVEAMLQADQGAGDFMKVKHVASPANAIPSEQAGDRIGRYKLLEQIGEGGFGVVWMAEQEEPVRRRVALKIIKLGMDTRQVLARFEAERQALALMEHPNIAKVFDGGATDTGRPYFVMELVKGIPITDYSDANKLSTRQRLTLFIQVCQAVQHAHQKGIIHRDLKPSNILVTEQDGRPMPKVIDFGVAKATQARLTERTLFTGLHQMIGTPAYMSPEQAGLGALDLDTRSDIYALGVLLYELLTGRTPFTKEEFEQAGLDEIFRLIREQDPPKPSTRLSTLTHEERTTISIRRQSEPAKLNKLLRGDLDWVVMKAMEKDRSRRYETANGLAMDLQRYLGSEPVSARPASKAYRLQKLARRNKLAFVAATVVVVALVTGLGLATMGLLQARIQRDRAVVANRLAQQEKNSADQARQQAQIEEKKAQAETLVAQQNLYAADVSLAQQAWENGNLSRTRSLLEGHRPRPGQPDLRGFEWRYLWKLSQGDQVHTFVGHADIVTCVAYSRDGRTLASGSRDGTVKLWNLATQKLAASLPAHAGHVFCLAFGPDNQTLATGGADGLVKFWDVTTRKLRSEFSQSAARIAFSPTAPIVAIGIGHPTYGGGGEVGLWDYARGDWVMRLPDCGARVAFSPDGKILATGSINDSIILWELATGKQLRVLGKAKELLALTFSPDGQTLAACHWSGEVKLWRVASGEPLGEFRGHDTVVFDLAFSHDGKLLATCSSDQTVRLWAVATQKQVVSLRGHGSEIWTVAFAPDDRSLATGGKEGAVMLWEVTREKETRAITNAVSPLAAMPEGGILGAIVCPPVFSRDSKLLVTGSDDNAVRIWDLATKRATAVFTGERLVLGFSSDGETLLTLNQNSTLNFWDLRTRTNRASIILAEGPSPLFWALLSPDAQVVATADYGSKIALWRANTGERLGPLRGHNHHVRGRAFSPDGKTLAAVSDDHIIKLWDVFDHDTAVTFPEQKDVVPAVAFSPDGETIATAHWDDIVKLWDRRTQKLLATLPGHKEGANSVAFSPDGRTLAAASADGAVRLWHLATRREVVILKHNKELCFVGFSPDGQILVTVDAEMSLHLWDAPTR